MTSECVSYACREGLIGIDLASPVECFFEEGQAFVAIIRIAGFIVQVPEQDAFVVAECSEDVGDVLL